MIDFTIERLDGFIRVLWFFIQVFCLSVKLTSQHLCYLFDIKSFMTK